MLFSGIVCDRLLQPEDKKDLLSSVKRFLARRRRLTDAICRTLAKMIVNFEDIEKVETVKMKSLREKYVEYSDIVYQLRLIDVKVQLEDSLEKLIGHIQEERARVKLLNLFMNQSRLSYNDFPEDSTAGGDSFDALSSKIRELKKVTKELGAMKMSAADKGSEKIDSERREELAKRNGCNDGKVNEVLVNEDAEAGTFQYHRKAGVDDFYRQDDEEGCYFVLYGMIRFA